MGQRYAQVIGIRPENVEEYETLHAAVWPEVLATIHACNIRNYSIFRHRELLIAYFEYVGTDFSADMARMARDVATQKWWSITNPMQEPLPGRSSGDWWLTLQEVFHTD